MGSGHSTPCAENIGTAAAAVAVADDNGGGGGGDVVVELGIVYARMVRTTHGGFPDAD